MNQSAYVKSSWDVSSAVYVREYSVNAKEIIPTGVFFKPDGSRMYTMGHDGNSVDEYNLGTSWDVSSAVYVREYDVSPKETILMEYSLNQMEVECILWVMRVIL